MKLNKTKIGILGGSFDPAHKGHLAISKEAKKRFELKNIIWAITKKNPFNDSNRHVPDQYPGLKTHRKFKKSGCSGFGACSPIFPYIPALGVLGG